MKDDLRTRVMQARWAHYQRPENPPIPDADYDRWVDALVRERAGPPCDAVGPPLRRPTWPVVSDCPSLDAWLATHDLLREGEPLAVMEWVRGVSVMLEYREGVLIHVWAGASWDALVALGSAQGIRARLDEKFTGEIAAEVVIPKELAAHFAAHDSLWLAAECLARGATPQLVCWAQVLCWHVHGKTFATVSDQVTWLTSMGFLTPRVYVTAMRPGVRTPHDLWVEYHSLRRILSHEVRGLVVWINDLAGRGARMCGVTFSSAVKVVTLRAIEWRTESTGVLTPMGHVDLAMWHGRPVTQVRWYSRADYIAVGGRVGQRVLVAATHDPVPYVVGPVTGSCDPPMACPACGGLVGGTSEGWFCTDARQCPPQRAAWWVGKTVVFAGTLACTHAVYGKRVLRAGGTTRTTVTPGVDLVVTNETATSSAKVALAISLGITCWSEEEFCAVLPSDES